ncbi:hypothetical protein N431DRAFT_433670 [Stipitochalara longipes BDJ]|nr:hypothetical protein N431DRAFT_433670 [Stipitochalara longipes BDJ]
MDSHGQPNWTFGSPSSQYLQFNPSSPMMNYLLATADPQAAHNYTGRVTPDFLTSMGRSRSRSIGNPNSPSQFFNFPWSPSPIFGTGSPFNSFRPLSANSNIQTHNPSGFVPARSLSRTSNSRRQSPLVPTNMPALPPPEPQSKADVSQKAQIPAGRTNRFTAAQWNEHKAEIKRLFLDEDKSLDETMRIMEEEHGFSPTRKQYNTKFRQWKFIKNIPGSTARWMAKKAQDRKRQGLETEFTIGGERWDLDRIESRAKRARIDMNDPDIEDMSTPPGVSYNVPGKDPEPIYDTRIKTATSMPPPPTKWAPRSSMQHTSPGYLRLQWEGKNKTDLDELHREAQSLTAAGNIRDAEEHYLQVLAGYEVILSPTHDNTCAVAYELANFYANLDRMNEADKVLDWLSEKHVERWGVGHKKTRAHLIAVADMVFRWGRIEDSMTLVLRAAENYEELVQASSSDEISSRGPQKIYRQNEIARDELKLPPLNGGTLAMYGDKDPVRMDYQMRVAITRAGAQERGSDALLVRLLKQAERQPEKLAVPILEARSALLKLYSSSDEYSKYEQALDQIDSAFSKIFDSKTKRTELLLDTAVELVGQLVKAERYKHADILLQRLQLEAAKNFGEHDNITISVLIRIGLLYQEEDRWKDARPRFEQALAASMASNGLRNMLTQRLEEALEKKSYTSSLPGSKDIRRQAELPDSSQRSQVHDLNHIFGFSCPVELMTAIFAP